MEQLSWTDDMMLRAEKPETPMQIQMLLIYDQSTAPDGRGHLQAHSRRDRCPTASGADIPPAADRPAGRPAHAVLGR